MQWVKKFYTQQNEWFGIYLGEVKERDRLRAQWLHQHLTPNQRILELGGGGGQTAIALAQLGHRVSMIELLEESAQHAEALQKNIPLQYPIEVIQGDFYKVSLNNTFDAICYFDSFGIGEDKDQRQLLQRIAQWSNPRAKILIEIGSPWFWGGIARGKELDLGGCVRRYEFDAQGSRLIDKWFLAESPEDVYFQSLRCYSPADFELLLQGTGLALCSVHPRGHIDFETWEFIEHSTLEQCMTYYALLELKA